MTPEAHELMELACEHLRELHRQSPEGMPRSAAHTAYYAMFHAARAVLFEEHGTVSSKHGTVLNAFRSLAFSLSPDARNQFAALQDVYSQRLHR